MTGLQGYLTTKNPVIKDNLASSVKFETLGRKDTPVLVWGHGWGQSRKGFLPLAAALDSFGKHIVIDFPGFGETPMPSSAWGTEEYADNAAEFIRTNCPGPVLWVGHSFGCRVGLQLAARHPELISGLALIAGAGLKRKRPIWQSLYFKTRIIVYKFLRKLLPLGLSKDWLMKKFGSPDYRNAGEMRKILVKVINEDLSAIAQNVRCPTLLIYGAKDTETPPEIGQRLKALIPNAELYILENQDHYTLLGEGRHQVAPILKKFMETLNA